LITLAMTGTIACTMDERVVIVGAGPAGLAAAWEIRRAGLDPLVIDRADAVAASWRGRHDHLLLAPVTSATLPASENRSSTGMSGSLIKPRFVSWPRHEGHSCGSCPWTSWAGHRIHHA
jgi:cation diffusion facilitator CzcD-associated flavoprotein CzcO